MKKALITGVGGQDGSYLAELLLEKGYEVWGVERTGSHRENLDTYIHKLNLIEGDVTDESFVQDLVSRSFDEIYNLASISTVQSPWEDPLGTIESTGMVPIYFLEAIRARAPKTKFFQASSAEMYGNPTESPQTEASPFNPRSPYGYGKLLAHEAVEGYRTQYNVFAVSGILFNHESPRRPPHFVTRKITSTLARIAAGSSETLELGNLNSERDWSFAGDIVEGMWLSLQAKTPDTYVYASGEVHTVREFVEAAAKAAGIPVSWQGSGSDEKGVDARGRTIVVVNPAFYRPVETVTRKGNPGKIASVLKWKPTTSFSSLVEMMVASEKK